MRRAALGAIILLFLALSPAFGADEAILLEQSQIVGGAPAQEGGREGVPADRPALSTSLPWGAEKEEDDLNIAGEILRRLMEPDPSYLAGEDFESPDRAPLQGEE